MTQDANSTGDAASKRPAPTLWAQRNQVVFLTFKVESCNNPNVNFEANKVCFSGQDHTTNEVFSNELVMFDEIKPEGCVWAKKGPGVECTLQKKENGFWPRLMQEKSKVHWLKVDFNKWQDEDEVEDEDEKDPSSDYDLSQMMAQMGGGMPGGMPNMDGLEEEEEEDSDDEDLPDLETAGTDDDETEEAPASEEKA